MKESINYYYGFNLTEVENWGDIYRFFYNNQYFYFVPFKRAISEIDDLVNVSRELKQRGILVHDIITNKLGKILTNVYNVNYVLLKPIGDIYEEYSLANVVQLNHKLILNETKSKLYRNSWAELWSSKLDYFEYQIHELGKSKSVILDSFSYYLGLGENAISYLNETNSKYKPDKRDRICLSHRRLFYPNYKLNFLNPLAFIFDMEVRDIASYLKSAFFSGEDALSYLNEVLRIETFSIYSYQLLYARLLYPSYYFDVYERVMNGEEEEEKLVPIIDRVNEYEQFLRDAYYAICNYALIDPVEWLLKDKK